MTPVRVIDGDIIHDPAFAGMGWLAQLLWYGLWHVADSWGLGEWNALALRAGCFPVDKRATADKVEKAMAEVAEKCKGIFFWEARGERFFSLQNWEEVVHPKYRKASWIRKLAKETGQQLKLGVRDESTRFGDKTVHGIGTVIGTVIGTGAESPTDKKSVDRRTEPRRPSPAFQQADGGMVSTQGRGEKPSLLPLKELLKHVPTVGKPARPGDPAPEK